MTGKLWLIFVVTNLLDLVQMAAETMRIGTFRISFSSLVAKFGWNKEQTILEQAHGDRCGDSIEILEHQLAGLVLVRVDGELE